MILQNFLQSKFALILLGAALTSVAFIGQQEWKGMIVAQPALATQESLTLGTGLIGFNHTTVDIERLPRALSASVDEGMLASVLRRHLNDTGIRVSSYDTLRTRFSRANKSADQLLLRASDEFFSSVYLNVNGARLSNGGYALAVSLEVNRGAFIYPGYSTSVTVRTYRMLSLVPEGFELQVAVESAIEQLMNEFVKDYKVANSR